VIKPDGKKTEYHFIKSTFKLSWPIILQNFLTSSLVLIDLLMIGQLNEESIAAVGIANQIVFVFFIVQFGIHSGVSIFTAQYWGKKDLTAIKKLIGISIMAGMVIGILFTIAALFFPRALLSFFIKDAVVIDIGSQYIRIVGISFWVSVLTYAYTASLRSTEVVSVPLVTSGVAVTLNIFLNYVLIFGHMGFPAMGVKGAAIATCLSRYVEGLGILIIVYLKKYPCAGNLSELTDFDFSFFRKVVDTCWPVFLNELFWVGGVTLYKFVYARMGTQSIAAVNIVASIEEFMLVPFFGLFAAGSILLGNAIGAGRFEEAFVYGKTLLRFPFILAIFIGGIMMISRGPVLAFYNISDTVSTNAYHLMMVAGIVLCFKITNFTLIVSILRGGGDTRYGFLLDLTGVWCIGVPMAFLGAFVFHLPVYWVMVLVSTEEIYKLYLGLKRFRSKKWIKYLV